jgi:hypothetical protein
VIAAPAGIVALYKCDPDWTDERTVIAFDDDGSPLVLERGRLRVAEDLPGFKTAVERGAPVGVLPGDGWSAQFRFHDGPLQTTPVIGWIVDSAGMGGALAAVDVDEGPVALRLDEYPGITDVELHAPTAPRPAGRLMAPTNGGS